MANLEYLGLYHQLTKRTQMYLSCDIQQYYLDSTDDEPEMLGMGQPYPVAQMYGGNAKKSIPKYKTELCKTYSEIGHCPYYYKCQYAHGPEELKFHQDKRKSYRTKRCKSFWGKGVCSYGSRCQFSHYEISPETRQLLKLYLQVLTCQEEGFNQESRLIARLVNQ